MNKINKIAAVSMIKNEADIVESFARHVLKIADLLIVTDHNSTDKTRSILESLQSEGLPIIIQTFDKIELLHEEVINSMIEQAIKLGADIVIPIDADEFIIKTDGNVDDVRRIFQNLDSNECYLMSWLNFALIEPEKDQEKFTLSRPLAFTLLNSMMKVIVGSRAYLENDLYVIRGNHSIGRKSEVLENFRFEKVAIPIDENFHLLNMHLPNRSQDQLKLKFLTMGITQTARFSKNNFYGAGYRDEVGKIFKNASDTNTSDTNASDTAETNSNAADTDSQPIDLSQYHDECTLKYTDGVIDSLQNIYLLAEDLADKYNRIQTLNKKIPVSIFVLHYGNADDTISTLDSIFKQTYEPIEIFVMPVVENDLDRLINWGESVPNYLELINYDLKTAVENSNGKYVQFVTAGDILKQNTVEEFVCTLEPQNFVRTLIQTPVLNPSRKAFFHNCEDVLNLILEKDFWFDLGISSIFYRREFIPSSLKFFIDDNQKAHGMRLLIESIWGGMSGMLQEDLIDRKNSNEPWSDEELKIFEQDLNFLRRQEF